jgi:ferredoxin-NADP reductase
VPLTLPIREVLPATPRARVVRVDLQGHSFPYQPGQALLIADYGFARRKPYSIAGAPEDAARDGCLELLVGVDSDGLAGPHLTLTPGQLVDVEGPVGRFTFPEEPVADSFVFIAGGTGIAPLRAMLRHALDTTHRRIGLFYSARTPSDFAYEDEWRRLADDGRIEFRQTITRDSTAPSEWTGERGRIGRDALASLVHGPATLCFVCGPPALVTDVPRLLDELGVPRERIRLEEWNSPSGS